MADIEKEIPGIAQEDIDAYDKWATFHKRQWEAQNPGKTIELSYNKKALQSFVKARTGAENEEADVIEEWIMSIDPEAKKKLDERLVAGELSVEEYKTIVKTLAWASGGPKTEEARLQRNQLYQKHLENIGQKDRRVIEAEREMERRMKGQQDAPPKSEDIIRKFPEEEAKSRKIAGLKEQDNAPAREELEGLTGKPQGEGELLRVENDLEEQAKELIKLNGIKAKDQAKEQVEAAVKFQERKLKELEAAPDRINFENGLLLAEYLEPKAADLNLSPEARALLSNLRKMYRAVNEGCSCTRQKRVDIATAAYRKSISELADKIGLIDAIKKASSKDKVLFSDNGEVFLEA